MNNSVLRLSVMAAMLGFAATSPSLAQTVQAPAPQGQPTYRLHMPTPPATPTPRSGQVQTIPVVPPPPTPVPPATTRSRPAGPPPAAQREPILPAVFRGCWRGRVDLLDRIERLPGAPPVGFWTPKTYVLCYRRVGNGPFQLTFSEAGVEHSRLITNAAGRMELLSTDGHDTASMRAYLRFDEYRKHHGRRRRSTFPVEEITNLRCVITGAGMRVWGSVFGRRDGVPWFRAWWHTTLTRVSGLPE